MPAMPNSPDNPDLSDDSRDEDDDGLQDDWPLPPADPDALISADDLGSRLLVRLFDRAYFTASIDSDGDVMLRERLIVYVIAGKPRKRLKFHTQFAIKPTAVEQGLVADLVNKLNSRFIVLKCFTHNNSLIFQHDMVTRAGLTGRQIVAAYRTFDEVVDVLMTGEMREDIQELLAE